MLVPFNRHLLVEPIVNQGDGGEAIVLIPESSINKSTYSLFKLLGIAPDCENFHHEVGSSLLINANMVEEISVGHEKYNVVLENYVVGLYYKNGSEV